jgi:hypothetical protein
MTDHVNEAIAVVAEAALPDLRFGASLAPGLAGRGCGRADQLDDLPGREPGAV